MASVLYGLSGKLLGELCSPVFQDFLIKPWGLGTKDEFNKLNNTLSAIAAVLLNAEEKQITDHQVRDWLMKIKPVFYDVEDLLQEISYEALKRQVMTRNKRAKEVRIFFSSSNQVKHRLKMGSKVKSIREELDAIALDSNRFSLAQRHDEMHMVRSKRREETHSFVSREKVIGRDEDIRSVTKLLLESDGEHNVSVISVVGIGGLGKTTLAQSVYNVDKVKKHFELMSWVCVSESFDVKLICEKIIESATEQKCEGLQMDVVKVKLKRVIDGKKYLLALDDVWNENPIEWMKLQELLIGGAKGSKILITTRTKLVARAAKSRSAHFLKGLSQVESWELFKQAAFELGVEPPSSIIVGIGRDVVDICAGVPLAIKTIGSMLGLKETEIDWLDFKRNDLPLITRDSEGGIVPILKLSYDYLSAPLKRCFGFCAIFPKDWKIKKKPLIRLWMAHELIQLDGTTRTLEEIGEQHLKDLLDRSLLEVYDKDEDGKYRYYKMHDLVHDLAQSVGGKEYCNLGEGVNYIDETTRHAWVSNHISTNALQAKKLRTLLRGSRDVLDGRTAKEIMSIFKKMRVLDLKRLSMARVPQFVNGLRHLSYLDLSNNTFDLLPESICTLYTLQTLLLKNCRNLRELPTGMRNLVSLSHLEIHNCVGLSHMPRGMEELTCLQTLTHFVTGPEDKKCGELGELKSLVNLRGGLVIRNLRESNVKKFERGQSCCPNPLVQLKFIQQLELDWSHEDEVSKEDEAELFLFETLKPNSSLENLTIKCYGGTMFPSWMDRVNIRVSIPNLVYIYIDSCHSWRHLPPFGLLPSLRELHLWTMGGMEYLYEEEEESPRTSNAQLFPSLKMLYLNMMPKLRRLVGPRATAHINDDKNQCFPALEKLVIWACPLFVADGSVDNDELQFLSISNLTEVEIYESSHIPLWLQDLPLLQTLRLAFCEEIVALPEWMGSLTSLEEIRLFHCKSLAAIPDCMRRLTSLKRLEVEGSPDLLVRCKKEMGEDWDKISHIPYVSVTVKYPLGQAP